MMTQKRKRYDRQFKISAAQVVPSGDMTVRELSEELQIKDPALRRWAQEYEAMGDGAFPGNGSPKTNKDHGIAKLEKKIEELERENRLLKKFPGLLESRPCTRYRFPKGRRGGLGPIGKACETLTATESGYPGFPGRRKSNAQIEREAPGRFAVEIFDRHKGRMAPQGGRLGHARQDHREACDRRLGAGGGP